MTLEEQSRLSYYRKIADISDHKNVELVQHVENSRIYVRKIQTVYDRRVYEILRELKDPFFPRIEECIEDEGKLIIVEDYISGETLQAALDRGKAFSLKQTADFIEQICSGLELLHSQDPPVVHRDIKPSNLILTDHGNLRLIDCNAARQFEKNKTMDTVLIGTQGYAAPEQYGFRQTDPRTDIYSLGILAHVLLTGHMPQAGLYKGPGTEVIQKCIQLDPVNRYADLNQLRTAWQEAVKQKEALCQREEKLTDWGKGADSQEEGRQETENAAKRETEGAVHQESEKPEEEKDETEVQQETEDVTKREEQRAAYHETERLSEREKGEGEEQRFGENTVKNENREKQKQESWNEKEEENITEETDEKPHNLDLPPGFRTGSVWKMLAAMAFYFGMFYFARDVGFENSGGVVNRVFWGNFIGLFMTELGWVLLWGNFRRIQSRLPLMNGNWLLKYGMLVLYSFLWISLMAFVCVAISGI